MDVKALMDGKKKDLAAWSVAIVFGVAAIAWSVGTGKAAGQEGGGSLVERLKANGASVTALGRTGELQGWLVRQSGGESYTLYVDGTGHAVMGVLFDPEGASVTRVQLGKARQADATPGGSRAPVERVRGAQGSDRSRISLEADRAKLEMERARAAVEAATAPPPLPSLPGDGVLEAALAVEGFDLGSSGPQVAVFADPTCFPSRLAVAGLSRRALEGEIRLRVVPVGVRGGDAEARAGAVLGSPERALAWFEGVREDGRPEVSADGAAAAAMNRSLFDRTGSEFVPLVLMRDAGGGTVSAVGLDFEAWFGEGAAR